MMTTDPRCWACLIWPVDERDAAETYTRRLAANHGWTGGEHIYGNGHLVLPRSAYWQDEDNLKFCPRCGEQIIPGDRHYANCVPSAARRRAS